MIPPCLIKHTKGCRNKLCQCSTFARNFVRWCSVLALNPCHNANSHEKESWLWYSLWPTPQGPILRWCCLVCDSREVEEHTSQWRSVKRLTGENPSSSLKFSNLRRHARQHYHRLAVATLLKKPLHSVTHAPSIGVFMDIFNQFHAGASPSKGYRLADGSIIGPKKAKRILWCLNEGLLEIKHNIVRGAAVGQIMRDARGGRLHVRFRCTNADLETQRGYLGQSRHHQQTTIGICDATYAVFKDFATRFKDPPKGCALRETLDQELLNHWRAILEAISVDSASNEAVAATDTIAAKERQEQRAFQHQSLTSLCSSTPHTKLDGC